MNSPNSTEITGLGQLEARLAEDLARLELPGKAWVIPRVVGNQKLLDVAIIGGGMAGLTVATALRNLGIQSQIFDRAPDGFEGPWATTARMETLRSPKQLTGPALGLPSLTFRAWFESQFGTEAWAELDKIPRLQWMDYLRWYRRVMKVPVLNDHAVEHVELHPEGYLVLTVRGPQGVQQIKARRLILATGRDGLGGPSYPSFAENVPPHLRCHSSDDYDYDTLAGKRVGVIGAGASAMDSAATALEAGAARVDLLIRRTDIPRINKNKGSGNPGLVHGYSRLPDNWKWRIRHYINAQQVPPPQGSTLRVSQYDNARFHVGCPIENVTSADDVLYVQTPKGTFELDFLIFATGFKIDWHLRPEYADFAPYVRTWADRYTPPAGRDDAELSACPDLGPNFEFQPKDGSALTGLSNILCFSYPAVASHGTVSGDIPAISDGAQSIAQGIAASFYQEDVDAYYAQMEAFSEPELEGHEWTPAPTEAYLNSTSKSDTLTD